jgi:hypothetical protein
MNIHVQVNEIVCESRKQTANNPIDGKQCSYYNLVHFEATKRKIEKRENSSSVWLSKDLNQDGDT